MFFRRACTRTYTLNISSLSCSSVSYHSTLPNVRCCPTVTTARARKWILVDLVFLFQTARISRWYLSSEAAEMQRVLAIV